MSVFRTINVLITVIFQDVVDDDDVTDHLAVDEIDDCGIINLIVVFKGYRSISDLMDRQLDDLISKVRKISLI